LKNLRFVIKILAIVCALPMLLMAYMLFAKVYAEETNGIPNKTDEQYFFNVILKRCIIIYYVLLAIILIWKFNQ
jgi:uncharacterized membrane protein